MQLLTQVLRSIVETAKKGVDKDLDSAIADCRSEIDSSFLLYLRDEAQRLEAIPGQASLSQLIRSIEGRAVEEIVRSTAEDADLISQLLLEGQKGLEHQTDAAKDMIRRFETNVCDKLVTSSFVPTSARLS